MDASMLWSQRVGMARSARKPATAWWPMRCRQARAVNASAFASRAAALVDDQLIDLQASDTRPAHREPPNGQRANRQCSESQSADGKGTECGGASGPGANGADSGRAGGALGRAVARAGTCLGFRGVAGSFRHGVFPLMVCSLLRQAVISLFKEPS